jgi:hypothetical protein
VIRPVDVFILKKPGVVASLYDMTSPSLSVAFTSYCQESFVLRFTTLAILVVILGDTL